MLWSTLFIPTLRENQSLLVRAGYTRPPVFLFLGQRSLAKIRRIVREEMNSIGGQEMLFSGEFPTSLQEVMNELRSYRQLPQIWYSFPGTLCESCSFDLDDASRAQYKEAALRIFGRCGLEDCPLCGGRAPEEPPVISDPDIEAPPEAFHTPGQKTIADIAAFTGLPATSQIKSLVMVADGTPILALVRGDRQLNDAKFREALHASYVRPALPSEINHWFGADAGSLGPVGLTRLRIVADFELESRRNMIAGANRNDYHLRNVTPGRDFAAEFMAIRQQAPDDACLACTGTRVRRAALRVTAADGAEVAPAVRHYRIELDRILDCSAERHHDAAGLHLPPSIAPFDAVLTTVHNADPAQRIAAQKIHDDCLAAGINALYDDRDERPGVKFKDADLIGAPYRVTIGKKLAQGLVELTGRRTRESRDIRLADVIAELNNARLAENPA